MSQREKDTRVFDELFALLKVTPGWLGPIIAIVAFAFMRWGLPAIISAVASGTEHGTAVSGPLLQIVPRLAPVVAFAVIAVWIVAEFQKFKDRKRLDSQTGIESIRALGWHEFERLLAEAFRRQGYAVDIVGGSGADGGVDIRLNKAGETTLVQCKHWKRKKVGVAIVRELLGAVASEGAQFGIVVTSGDFTNEAREFAAINPIRLMDGQQIARLIGELTGNYEALASAASQTQQTEMPRCPSCQSKMVLRTAKKGPNAGSQFWGCTEYPKCRGTRTC